MSDTANPPASQSETVSETITMTQADLDRIIQDRLSKQKASLERSMAKAREDEAEAARIKSLEGEERVRAEFEARIKAQNDQLKEAEARNAEIARELAVSKATTKLAAQGLPVELAPRITGDTDAETDANIAAIRKVIETEVSKQVQAGLAHGAPANAQANPSDSVLDEIARAMRRRTTEGGMET